MKTTEAIEYTMAMFQSEFQGKFSTSNERFALWVDILGEFKAETILTVCKQITASSEWPPPVATVRKACINIEQGTLRAVSPPEAWDSVTAYKNKKKTKEQLSALELRALQHIGGTWEMRMNEKPGILRSQFMNAYSEYLKTAEAERVALPETKILAMTNAAIQKKPQLVASSEPLSTNDITGTPVTQKDIQDIIQGASNHMSIRKGKAI